MVRLANTVYAATGADLQDYEFNKKVAYLAGSSDIPGWALLARDFRTPQKKVPMPTAWGERMRTKIASLYKDAVAGPSPHRQFSEAFASMGYTYLQSQAPSLLQFLVGFQTVERAEDGRKAFGVFGFKLPDRIVQAPMFFINGEVKGYQLLFLPKSGLFMPLREAFIDDLLSQSPSELGELGPRLTDQNAFADPSHVGTSVARLVAKNAADMRPWAREMKLAETYASVAANPKYKTAVADFHEKKANNTLVDPVRWAGESEGMFKAAANLALAYPVFNRYLHARDPQWIEKAAERVKQANARRREANNFTRRESKIAASLFEGPRKTSDISPISAFTGDEPPRWLPKRAGDEYRRQIIHNGVAFHDNRPMEKVAKPVRIDSKETYGSPTETGVYQVLVDEGMPGGEEIRTRRCLVVPSNKWLTQGSRDMVIAMTGDHTMASVAKPGVMTVFDEDPTDHEHAAFQTAFSRMKSPKNLTVGKAYIFFNEDGNAVGPYVIREKEGENAYSVSEPEAYHSNLSIPDNMGDPYVRPVGANRLIEYADRLIVTKSKDPCFVGEEGNGTVYVPSVARAHAVPLVDDGGPDGVYSHRLKTGIRPRVLAVRDIEYIAKRSQLHVKADQTAGQFQINGDRLTRKDAMRYLVKGAALSVYDAERVLAEASHSVKHYLLKRANNEDGFGQPLREPRLLMPQLQGPVGADTTSSTIPFTLDEGEALEESADTMADDSQLATANEPTPDPLQEQRSARIGVQDQQLLEDDPSAALDVVAVASMAQNNRVDNMLHRVASSILRTNSDIGGTILLYYAQQESFDEIYGEQDSQSLESQLINAFEKNGDVYIDLRKQTVSPDPENDAAVETGEIPLE